MANLLSRDLDHVLAHTRVWDQLRDQSLFVTGASGFVGTWLVESLLWANEKSDLGVELTLLTRDAAAYCAKAPLVAANPRVHIVQGDIASFKFPLGKFEYVIHAATEQAASLTANPAGAFTKDVDGTRRVLEFAATHGTKRLLFTSSGAVYGKQPADVANVPEDYPGAPLTNDSGSAYGQAKRASEWLCTSYAKQHGFDAVIARLFAFVGPHLPMNANFAAGNFLRDVLAGGPVQIAGDGTPYRSYLYAADLAVWLLTLLVEGKASRPYNVGSGEALTIANLAKAVVTNTKPDTAIHIAKPATAGAAGSRYVPSVERAKTELGLSPIIGLDESVRRTYEWAMAQGSQKAAAAAASFGAAVAGKPSSNQIAQKQPRVRVADYIASRLADWGVRHMFLVTGGGAMHLNDGFAREPRIRYFCTHHEQAAAMAAESYARVTGRPGLINVTTGPGGINALNGVFGAWTDSIPMLVVSGQVKRATCMATAGATNLRQLGDQEADIISIVKGITKYAVLVEDPATIRYHLERAWRLAQSGRPGPCWLDVPTDVASAQVDADALRGYDPAEDDVAIDESVLREKVKEVVARLKKAERPALLIGSGVRLSGAIAELAEVARVLHIPVTTAWTAHDAYPTDDELYCGRPSVVGDRAGNFTVQNSDLLIIIGCKLSIRQVSYNWEYFARAAYKVQVDIDPAEFEKPTVRPDLAITSDARVFLLELKSQLRDGYKPQHGTWLKWCQERVKRYDLRTKYPKMSNGLINPYSFVGEVFKHLRDDDVIVCGDGSACVLPFQVGTIRGTQRLYTNGGSASMGYDLPAAVGAAVAREGKRVICFAGDGSLQMNIQELETVVHNRLPIKLFVLNNDGYLSMRMTQAAFFGRLVGESPQSGVGIPDFTAIAKAYGLPSMRIDGEDYPERIKTALADDAVLVCEVNVDPAQPFEPRLSSRALPDGRMVSSPLEDLWPFLDREELAENMIIPQVKQ